MKDSLTRKHNNSLYLTIESKLGALEKVIGVFTLRGYKIENLIYTQNKNNNFVDLKITLGCTDQELERLVKILHNLIYVLEIKFILDENHQDYELIAIAS